MKRFAIVLSMFLLFAGNLDAQRGDLFVKSGEKGLFLEHKVAAKENFFSIGRLYTVHPRFIASYNKLDMNKGLAIGQLVRIPLTDSNFIQTGNTGVPLYYKLGEGEGLMKVSSLHKNVTLESLRNWNSLSDNKVDAGSNLVVGFLVTKEIPSVTLTRKDPVEKKPEPVEAKQAVQKENVASAPPTNVPVAVEKKEAKTIEKKDEPTAPVTKDATPIFASQEQKQGALDNGYFKSQFERQIRQSPIKKDQTLTSGTFKTTSGWVDSKYYLLIDGVQPGTIIKITNPANNKFIFAKVLGEMTGIRQNDGLDIRISSAGASALQITEEDKFIVKVNY